MYIYVVCLESNGDINANVVRRRFSFVRTGVSMMRFCLIICVRTLGEEQGE